MKYWMYLMVLALFIGLPALAQIDYGQLESEAGTGYLGNEEDSVVLDASTVFLTGPEGWRKEANMYSNNKQSFYYLKYTPEGTTEGSAFILVTGLKVPDTDVVKSAQRSVDSFRKKMPQFKFSDAKPVKAKKLAGAYFERISDTDDSFWARYQFLIDGRALKIQLMESAGRDKKNLAALEKMIKSIRVEEKK